MLAIVNGTVYTPTRLISDGVVLVDGERVLAVGTRDQVTLTGDVRRIDVAGGYVCPGLVDIHTHGGWGADFTDGDPEALRLAVRRHLVDGTTSLLATTGTAPLPEVWRAFDAIRERMRHPDPGGSRVLGIHMEGPFLSPAQAGAHDPALLRMPAPDERERLLSYAGDLARVTLAPELDGALDLIADLAGRGVLVSGGHSDALYAQVCRAMEAGMRHITHLWSGMSTVRRIGPKRHAGMLEAALMEDGLTGEIIADGYHLPTSLMRMAVRLKGVDRLCLVSDAMRASGAEPGEYDVCGLKAVVEPGGGVALTADRTAFAGSIATMRQCLLQMVQVVGLSFGDALRMATLTPATILGVEDRVGRLAPGCLADLLVLERGTLDVRHLLLGGVTIHTEPGYTQ
jgi:N-acetylglucosamine-6-phosphate deacetylase